MHKTSELHRGSCRTSTKCRGQRPLGWRGILRRGWAGAALHTFCRKSRLLHLAAERPACLSVPLSPWPPPHQQVHKINVVATAFRKYLRQSFHWSWIVSTVLALLWCPLLEHTEEGKKSWLEVKHPLSSFSEHPLKIAAPTCASLLISSTKRRSSAPTALCSSQSKVSLSQMLSVPF